MSLVHYATPAIATAVEEIQHVSAQTEANRQRSIQIVTANADNFGGQGANGFQDAIALINQKYADSQQAIHAASVALNQANEGMTQADMQMRGQYA
ncbi:WXG100 family type VII secretion target [Mycobacterium sp. DSM 3803]|jgi:uncharacterized protein YukE|nr:WXG100 family type VII secretion target [Mycobacterium sp. DSM 3803]OKH61723.1 hypothetical protein EB73_29455 [Mycobacterium sp. SWH-M3]